MGSFWRIAVVLSFAGLVLTCLAWVLSPSSYLTPRWLEVPLGRVPNSATWPKPWSLAVAGGLISLGREYRQSVERDSVTVESYAVFHVGRVHGSDGGIGFWYVGTYLWLLAAIFAVLPAFWLATMRRRRRAHRRKLGLCENCGYDLRGSPEPRCPECGMGS